MAKKAGSVLTQLTTAQLKKLLAARKRIDVLEADKARLLKQLAAIEAELAKLVAGAAPRKTRKKTVRKKTTRKKTVRKAAAKKTTRKKTGRKKTVGKKPVRKKAATRKAPAGKRVSLEDVILAVLKKAGGKMAFKDLHTTIVKGKLYKSKATKFDNVLRRTLSTSKKVKRVGRGIYAAA